MKKIAIFVVLAFLLVFGVMAGMGSAPNSGDGISDGSGLDNPYQDGNMNPDSEARGPAPNSGDGIPDGSGF